MEPIGFKLAAMIHCIAGNSGSSEIGAATALRLESQAQQT